MNGLTKPGTRKIGVIITYCICEQTMPRRACASDLQLNKGNSSDTEAPFLDLDLPITNDIVSSKIYD